MEMSEFKNKHKNTSGHLIRVITHMEHAGQLSYIGLTNIKKSMELNAHNVYIITKSE